MKCFLMALVAASMAAAGILASAHSVAADDPEISATGGRGVAVRHDCRQEARTGRGPGIPEGELVEVMAEGVGRCEGWLVVRGRSVQTWVKEQYVDGYEPTAPLTGGAESDGDYPTADEIAAAVVESMGESRYPTAEQIAAALTVPTLEQIAAAITVPTVEQIAAAVVESMGQGRYPTAEQIAAALTVPTVEQIAAAITVPTVDQIASAIFVPSAAEIAEAIDVPTADQIADQVIEALFMWAHEELE